MTGRICFPPLSSELAKCPATDRNAAEQLRLDSVRREHPPCGPNELAAVMHQASTVQARESGLHSSANSPKRASAASTVGAV